MSPEIGGSARRVVGPVIAQISRLFRGEGQNTDPEPQQLIDPERWQIVYLDENMVKEHLDGIAWHAAPLPPEDHSCSSQTRGCVEYDQVQRCSCGGIRMNCGAWHEKNSRSTYSVEQ